MTTTKTAVRYYSNGHPLKDHSNTMAHVAVRSTKGCGKNGDKLTSAELRKLLAKAGIDTDTTWAFELPNGKIIGAVYDDDKVPTLISKIVTRTGKRPAKPWTKNGFTLTIKKRAERSFVVLNGDGEQVGNVHRSLKAAEKAIEKQLGA